MIELNKKYGCLTVLDMGEEYFQSDEYLSYKQEKNMFIQKHKEFFEPNDEEKIKRLEQTYSISSSLKEKIINGGSDFDKLFLKLLGYNPLEIIEFIDCWSDINSKLENHYKCKCKCGRTHFYNAKTIESNPKYCIYPVYISSRHTNSVKAQNANYHKKQEFENIECVILCDKSNCIPSDEYCELYNKYKRKQTEKKKEKRKSETEKLPRVYAKNYDIDFTGRQYESLYIEECCDDHFEGEATFRWTQQHRKQWSPITIYKKYNCKCCICKKEIIVTCDKFGIFPPTQYGFRAYNGYWSKIQCDCHKVSSFQWIVNKLLFENNIPYKVEVSFEGLYGTFMVKRLKYDFAVYDKNGNIKCLIECQGEQHYKPVSEFGGQSQFEIQQKNDESKRLYAKVHHIPLIEISYKDKKYDKIKELLTNYGII